MSIRVSSLVLNVGIPLGLSLAAQRIGGGNPLWWWLFYVNLQVLILLAKDKLSALQKWHRTPESTLLLLAFLGGSPALLLGRFIFRHKTKKQSFVVQLMGVMAVQAAALWYFWPQLKTFI